MGDGGIFILVREDIDHVMILSSGKASLTTSMMLFQMTVKAERLSGFKLNSLI